MKLLLKLLEHRFNSRQSDFSANEKIKLNEQNLSRKTIIIKLQFLSSVKDYAL